MPHTSVYPDAVFNLIQLNVDLCMYKKISKADLLSGRIKCDM